jgi:hypothetical protein
MDELLTNNVPALRMLMTDELFFIPEAPSVKTQADVSGLSDRVAPTSFSYLGENNKYFLILVSEPAHEHLNKDHLEMLLKILQAKNLELRDVAILNLNSYPGISFNPIKEFFAPSKVVLFGIDPKVIGLAPMSSNELHMQENIKFLATYHFDEMKDDQNKKRVLWNALKPF